MTDKGAGVGTTAAGQGRINLQTLWTHVQQNPGTSALRGLRDEFVQDGIPLDKLTPTPGLGSHDAWVNASDPEQKLREYMKWVVSTNQYSSSTAPLFLAQATITWLKSAAAPDGTLDRQRVGQLERKLAERSQRRDPARRIAEHLGTGGVESPHIPALDAVKQQHEAAQTFKDSKVLVPQHLSLPGLDPASSETRPRNTRQVAEKSPQRPFSATCQGRVSHSRASSEAVAHSRSAPTSGQTSRIGILRKQPPLFDFGGSRPASMFTCTLGKSRRGAARVLSRAWRFATNSGFEVSAVSWTFSFLLAPIVVSKASLRPLGW
jgi:hypothetical protein